MSVSPRWRWKSKPTARSLSSAKSQPPANIPTCPISASKVLWRLPAASSPRALRDRVTLTHTDGAGPRRRAGGTARHRHQSRRYRAGRMANAGSDHAFHRRSRSAASYPARGARAGRRDLPSYPRPRQRQADRLRPPGRHYRRQPDRRVRTRNAALAEISPPPPARRAPSCDPPRAFPHRRSCMGALHAPDPAAEATRAARTRRQSRCLHSPDAPFQRTPFASIRRIVGGSLHYFLYPRNTFKGALSMAVWNAR